MASTEGTPPGPAQQSLFEDLPLDLAPDLRGLVRVPSRFEGSLSPLQKKFNNLARKIEQLRGHIEEKTASNDEILEYWAKMLTPMQGEVASCQTKLAFAIDNRANGFKLGVRQQEAVGMAIVGLLGDAFNLAEPGEEAQALFTRWNGLSFEEEIESQNRDMDEDLREVMREELGVEISPEDWGKGPEGMEEALMEAFMKALGGPEKATKPRKKTAKQIAKEERDKKAEEYTKRSLRSLYLSLVKLLHPDIERDAAAREVKEGTMKEVTAAYEAGDLHTLLRIEMEWIAKMTVGDEPLPEEKLQAYISALSAQVRELQEELEALDYSPRYMPIVGVLGVDVLWAKERIDTEGRQWKQRVRQLEELVRGFSTNLAKKDFMAAIKEMIKD